MQSHGRRSRVETMIIVVEPGRRSVGVMEEIRRLATDIGLRRLYLVGNKVRGESDQAFIRQIADDLPLIGFLPYDPQVIEADLTGQAVYDIAPETVAAGRGIWQKLEFT